MTIYAHPELPEFEYVQPASLEEACRFLADHAGEARPLLGGTDIFVRMRDGVWKDRYLVDIKRINRSEKLVHDEKVGLRIPAAATMNQIIASPEVQQHYPLLAEACRTVASYQLRNRATLIGNICNASPAGDSIGACLVYDACLQVYGLDGYRRLSLNDFFKGPGITALAAGDVVIAVEFPSPPQDCVGTYLKLNRNRMGDLAIVGVTALAYPDQGSRSGFNFRIALASVAPTPFIPTSAEQHLQNTDFTPYSIKEAARLCAESCRPIDDVRGSAEYRRAMVQNLAAQALFLIWQKLGGAKEAAL